MPVHGRLTAPPGGPAWVSDIYVAAYLVALGHDVNHIEPEDEECRRYRFVFASARGLKGSYEKFQRNSPIGVRTYIAGLEGLKELIRAAEQAG